MLIYCESANSNADKTKQREAKWTAAARGSSERGWWVRPVVEGLREVTESRSDGETQASKQASWHLSDSLATWTSSTAHRVRQGPLGSLAGNISGPCSVRIQGWCAASRTAASGAFVCKHPGGDWPPKKYLPFPAAGFLDGLVLPCLLGNRRYSQRFSGIPAFPFEV